MFTVQVQQELEPQFCLTFINNLALNHDNTHDEAFAAQESMHSVSTLLLLHMHRIANKQYEHTLLFLEVLVMIIGLSGVQFREKLGK